MTYEFNGEEYKEASTHQKEWGNRIIAEFQFKGNERILDLGCGDGILTAQLAKLVPEGYVLGIDSSQSMIDSAIKLQGKTLSFKLMDIDYMDYHEEFDLVFSNASLHWVKDHKRLLNNTFVALKENGILRFNFGVKGNCSHFIKVIKEMMELRQYSGYFSGFEWPWFMPAIEEYEAILKTIPFTETRIWVEIADRYFPDTSSMIKWIDQPSIVPFLKSVPQSDKPAFRDSVVEKMLQETQQKDGTCFETFRRINVFARK
ncbi:MAG: methyltransferase domain-containing protein [Chloroflexi bacterium]|nr:methyltransferase domain-containing protein [Chloroflexota bacterium]